MTGTDWPLEDPREVSEGSHQRLVLFSVGGGVKKAITGALSGSSSTKMKDVRNYCNKFLLYLVGDGPEGPPGLGDTVLLSSITFFRQPSSEWTHLSRVQNLQLFFSAKELAVSNSISIFFFVYKS